MMTDSQSLTYRTLRAEGMPACEAIRWARGPVRLETRTDDYGSEIDHYRHPAEFVAMVRFCFGDAAADELSYDEDDAWDGDYRSHLAVCRCADTLADD